MGTRRTKALLQLGNLRRKKSCGGGDLEVYGASREFERQKLGLRGASRSVGGYLLTGLRPYPVASFLGWALAELLGHLAIYLLGHRGGLRTWLFACSLRCFASYLLCCLLALARYWLRAPWLPSSQWSYCNRHCRSLLKWRQLRHALMSLLSVMFLTEEGH